MDSTEALNFEVLTCGRSRVANIDDIAYFHAGVLKIVRRNIRRALVVEPAAFLERTVPSPKNICAAPRLCTCRSGSKNGVIRNSLERESLEHVLAGQKCLRYGKYHLPFACIPPLSRIYHHSSCSSGQDCRNPSCRAPSTDTRCCRCRN